MLRTKILNNLKEALNGKKLVRLAHTLDEGLEQTVLDIPQEIWYKYPTMGEDFIKTKLGEKEIKCVRPFPSRHRDRSYTYDELIWKMIADKYLEDVEEELIFFCYKNSTNLDEAAHDYGLKTIMPEYGLYKEFQHKGNLESYGVKEGLGLLPFFETNLSETEYSQCQAKFGDKFVVQFSFSKSGWNTRGSRDTYIIKNEADFLKVKNESHDRNDLAKISKFVEGNAICMNVVVLSTGIVTSDCYLQVTGDPTLYDSDVILSGANFAESYDYITPEIQKQAEAIARSIGEALKLKNYRGHFGIDFIVEKETREVYVLEINPRFTGSTWFHTFLANKKDKLPLIALHFATHLDCLPESFLVEEYEAEMRGIWQGGSFYLRNKEGQGVQIEKAPRPGIYKITENGEIEFMVEEYDLNHLPEKDAFLVKQVYPLKRDVFPPDPICNVYSLEKIFDGDKELTSKYKKVAEQLYAQFDFIPEGSYDSTVPYKV